MFETSLSLNGEWQFRLGDQTGPIQVPGVWEIQGYRRDLEGPAVYRRAVAVPADWAGSRIVLRFGAVSYKVEVFVNGHRLGDHEGLWAAFEFDVTDVIRFEQPNDIVFSVVKPGRDGATYHFRDVLVGFIPYVSLAFGGPWQGIVCQLRCRCDRRRFREHVDGLEPRR